MSASDKPKLALLINEDWFFASHFLTRAKAAQDAGFDVTIIARNSGDAETAKALKGLSFIDFSMRRADANPFTLVSEVSKLRAIYSQLRPDIAHHVGLRPMIVGALAATGIRVRSIVNAPVGLGFTFSSDSILAWIVRQPLRLLLRFPFKRKNATLIVENSDDLAEIADRYRLPVSRVRLIEGAGVNFSRFRGVDHLREHDDAAKTAPTVMLGSRMLREKGVYEFVEAIRTVRAAGLSARFVLVGAPDKENPGYIPEKTLRSWHEEGIVEWWGHSSRMAEMLQEADIFVLPSYREGLPKVVVEAIASGCAIVTTDVPGCRQVIEGGKTGLLVPARNSSSLATALTSLIENPEKRRRLALAAYEDARARFAEEIIVTKTLDTYREILSLDQ